MSQQRQKRDYAKDEMLISLVKENPCLFDMRNPNFKDNRGVKANVWKRILEVMVEKFGPQPNFNPGE